LRKGGEGDFGGTRACWKSKEEKITEADGAKERVQNRELVEREKRKTETLNKAWPNLGN